MALHIAAARFKGAPLPEELPRGLMPDGVEFNPRNSQVEAASVAAHSGGGVPGEASAAKSRWRMGGSASRIATGRNAAPPPPQQQQHYAHTGGGMAGGAYSRAGVLKHEKKACVLPPPIHTHTPPLQNPLVPLPWRQGAARASEAVALGRLEGQRRL